MTIPVYTPELVRRLGSKFGTLPMLGSGDQVHQVMVVADFASGLANDPQEARGYAGATSLTSAVELHAVAAGGVVIEAMAFSDAVNFELFSSSQLGGAGTPANVLQCGGAPAQSTVETGIAGSLVNPVTWFVGLSVPLRIFVPGGAFLVAEAAGQFSFALLWRELTAGGPT